MYLFPQQRLQSRSRVPTFHVVHGRAACVVFLDSVRGSNRVEVVALVHPWQRIARISRPSLWVGVRTDHHQHTYVEGAVSARIVLVRPLEISVYFGSSGLRGVLLHSGDGRSAIPSVLQRSQCRVTAKPMRMWRVASSQAASPSRTRRPYVVRMNRSPRASP